MRVGATCSAKRVPASELDPRLGIDTRPDHRALIDVVGTRTLRKRLARSPRSRTARIHVFASGGRVYRALLHNSQSAYGAASTARISDARPSASPAERYPSHPEGPRHWMQQLQASSVRSSPSHRLPRNGLLRAVPGLVVESTNASSRSP